MCQSGPVKVCVDVCNPGQILKIKAAEGMGKGNWSIKLELVKGA